MLGKTTPESKFWFCANPANFAQLEGPMMRISTYNTIQATAIALLSCSQIITAIFSVLDPEERQFEIM